MFRNCVIALYAFAFLISPHVAQSDKGNNDVTYVSTVDDLTALKDVVNLTGSLFIHSGYDITTNDLCLLESLEQIEGYLVVWKSPGIRSLKCLNNLKSINGKELHIGSPPNSVFIEDNVNHTSGVGLCFVNTLDWSLLTSHHISISDNGVDCPGCNSECTTCWGVGPRLCQTCINYKSGVTCVSKCPYGTILDDVTKTCKEFQPQVDSLSFMNVFQELVKDNVHVTFDWSLLLNLSSDSSVILNGVPLGYRLYLDGELVFEEEYHDFHYHNENSHVDHDHEEQDHDDDHFEEYDGLTEKFLPLSERLVLNTSQTYRIEFQVLNTIGWSLMSPSINLTTMDGIPMPVKNLSVTFDDTNVTVSWLPPSTNNGELHCFHVKLFQRNGTVWSSIHSLNLPADVTSHTISLENSVEYSVCITTLNRNWDSIPVCDVFQVPNVTTTTNSPYTGPPAAVTYLTVDIVNSTTVVVSWNSLSDDHQVTLSNSTYYSTHNMSETSMVFDNLKPFTFYTVEVVAIDQFGESPVVSANWTTPYSNPPVPDAPVLYQEKLHDIWICLKPVSDEFGYVDNYTLHVHVNVTSHDDESFPIPRLTVITAVKLSDFMDVHDHHVYTFRFEAHVSDLSSISAYSDNMTTLQPHKDKGAVYMIVIVSLFGGIFIIVIIQVIILIWRRRRVKTTNATIPMSNTSRHRINSNYESAPPGTVLNAFTNPTYNGSMTTICNTDGLSISDEYGFGVKDDQYGKYDSLPCVTGEIWRESTTDDDYVHIQRAIHGMVPKKHDV